jgi:DNA-binding response OmpR family regulator
LTFWSRRSPLILMIYAGAGGEAYVRYLTEAGFRVESASCAQVAEVVGRTLAIRPDMIVLDYDCNGDVVERLKADARTAAVPIIALADLPARQRPSGMRRTSATAPL